MSEYYGELVADVIREFVLRQKTHETEHYKLQLSAFIHSNFPDSIRSRTNKIVELLSKCTTRAAEEKIMREFIELIGAESAEYQKLKIDDLFELNEKLIKSVLSTRSSTSYVSSVLRPLSITELEKTVLQRNDLSFERLKKRANTLLEEKIDFRINYKDWTNSVYSLFEEVTLYDINPEKQNNRLRPYGTISNSSKRPYGYAWKEIQSNKNIAEIEELCKTRIQNIDNASMLEISKSDEVLTKAKSGFKAVAKVAAVTAVSPVLGSLYIAIGGTNKFSKKWSFDNLRSSSLIDWVSLVDSLQNKNEKVDTKINIVNDGEEEEILLSADSWSVNKIKLLRLLESYASNTTALSKHNPTLKHDLEQAIAKIKSGETL
jgi:hypothetical protein